MASSDLSWAAAEAAWLEHNATTEAMNILREEFGGMAGFPLVSRVREAEID
jgi:hypothetical protein